ncbi:MAG: signal-transduction protein with cAMP-binding, CBS, and nucleotidyltransferase domain [Planctomycetota bacterium]|jgi:signal-transduction protein with cAMP-binding, CBS, and nucleotidyltransferase domain
MSSYKDTPVRQIMMQDVRMVDPLASLASAAQVMLDMNITCLVVDLQDPSKGLGIITQKDVVGHLFDDLGELESTTVADVMSQPTIGLAPEWSLETAVSMMRMLGIRRAPVLEQGRLVGLLSFTDVFRHAISK